MKGIGDVDIRSKILAAVEEAVGSLEGVKIKPTSGSMRKIIPIATNRLAEVRKGHTMVEVAYGPGIDPSETLIGMTVFRKGVHDHEASKAGHTHEEIVQHLTKVLT